MKSPNRELSRPLTYPSLVAVLRHYSLQQRAALLKHVPAIAKFERNIAYTLKSVRFTSSVSPECVDVVDVELDDASWTVTVTQTDRLVTHFLDRPGTLIRNLRFSDSFPIIPIAPKWIDSMSIRINDTAPTAAFFDTFRTRTAFGTVEIVNFDQKSDVFAALREFRIDFLRIHTHLLQNAQSLLDVPAKRLEICEDTNTSRVPIGNRPDYTSRLLQFAEKFRSSTELRLGSVYKIEDVPWNRPFEMIGNVELEQGIVRIGGRKVSDELFSIPAPGNREIVVYRQLADENTNECWAHTLVELAEPGTAASKSQLIH